MVDDSGTPLMVTDRCRRLRYLKGELLSVTKEDGSDCYTDLKTNRTYQERPVVFSYGGIEVYAFRVRLWKVSPTDVCSSDL